MEPRLALDGRAIAAMLLLCLIWSLQQISLKAGAGDVSPMLMVGLRSGIAVLMVAALMRWRGEGLVLRAGRWRPGLVVGALFALEYLLLAEALRLTHASHVVVFLYTAPLFAALGLHWKLPAERLEWLQWAGIAMAFAGIAVAFLGPGAGATERSGLTNATDLPNLPSLPTGHVLLGDLLALLAGAAWGATTVTIRASSLSAAPATETLFYQLAGAFALLIPAALITGQSHFDATSAAWGHLAFQSLIVSFASFLAWFCLLRRYLASRLGVLSFMTPVFGIVLGIWLLGEPLELAFIVGSGLVLAGIVLVSGAAWLRQAWAGSMRGRTARGNRVASVERPHGAAPGSAASGLPDGCRARDASA